MVFCADTRGLFSRMPHISRTRSNIVAPRAARERVLQCFCVALYKSAPTMQNWYFCLGWLSSGKLHSPIELLKCVRGCDSPGEAVQVLRVSLKNMWTSRRTTKSSLHIWECPPMAPCRHAFDEASSHHKISKPLTLLALTCIPPKDWCKNRYDLVLGHGLSIKCV